ncbi:MAG: type II CAAX endopeptidase family protein [Euryarchaeota archaeon]|nr:type II CAAX endopeptidase family protein [Euryarchaeota archaeon]
MAAEVEDSDRSGMHPDLRKKLILALPILAIAIAEWRFFVGDIYISTWIHVITLVSIAISTIWLSGGDEEGSACQARVLPALQALLLLPLLRLVNISMPVFFELTLYQFIFIYTPMIIPIVLIARSQHFTYAQLGLTSDRIWIYLPVSLAVGLLVAGGEYMTIHPGYLIPELSGINLLKLILVMLLFVGLVEELIFRSVLQTRLESVLGEWGGLIVASVLFGLMHSGYGTPYEMFYTALVGLLLGYMFQRTRSLPLVAMTHGFANVFLFGVIPHLI